MRPTAILELTDVLQSLALNGAVPASATGGLWLTSVGAVHLDALEQWLCTDPEWFHNIARARSLLEVVRRTAIRDPLYRFHVDTMVAEVLESIGRSGRWQRLEELLFGPLLPFATRFVQLLDFVREQTDGSTGIHHWDSLRRGIEKANSPIFEEWDRLLWADARGGAAALFPVLLDLYIPLCDGVVSVHPELHGLSEPSVEVLAAIVECARRGECGLVDPALKPELNPLYNIGLPVRQWIVDSSAPDRRLRVGLAAPVRLLLGHERATQNEGIAVVPLDKEHVKTSFVETLQRAVAQSQRQDFWSRDPSRNQSSAFPGLRLGETWPTEPLLAPKGVQVPAAQRLHGLGLSRRRSPDVDEALQMLSDHLMFGSLLQLLLLEALDRELGQETITLSCTKSEQDGKPSTQIQFYYRPVEESDGRERRRDFPTYALGDFDSVLNRLTGRLNIQAMPFSIGSFGPTFWATALFMLEQVGILFLDTSKSRCCLSLEALDRLHGGDLMTRVIRSGQRTRESMRSALSEMWKAIDSTQGAGVLTNVN